MAVQFSLLTLKEEKMELENELNILERVDAKKSARRITQLKHQIADLEFAIEVLETWED